MSANPLPWAVEAEPITAADALATFHRSSKPRRLFRVGAEFEKFALDRATGRPLTYDEPGGLHDILHAFADRFDWMPHHEAGQVTSLSRGGSTITLEPGCQLELSTAAAVSLREIAAELDQHRAELQAVVETRKVAWVAAGVTPVAVADSIPSGPRLRHAATADYMLTKSPMARAMMYATASTQATFDYSDEADAVRKMTVALKLGPVFNALLANSRVVHGERSSWASVRGRIWQGMDAERCGCLVPLLKRGLSFETYRDYLLDVPMLFQYRRGEFRPANGRTFREFLARGVNGDFPTAADWELHQTTVFPEVRLKGYLEIRGADATPPATALAVPAFWKGLLYDDTALAAAGDIARRIQPDDLPTLWACTHRYGLRAEFDGKPVGELATELLRIASHGLTAQGEADAVRHLNAVRERRDTAESYADVLVNSEY